MRSPSPYKFLASYDVDDRNRFFGREIETDVLLADVVVSRLVVLFAKTGTGKTSLINAGVRPQLKDRGYETYFIRVRGDPVAEARAVFRKETGKRFPATVPFAQQVRELASDRPIVLFFDQFEEFFLYLVASDIERAEEFVAAIADIYDDRESGVHVVFSMREEWFVDMGLFRERIPAIFHNEANLRLRWFNRQQARDAIVKPAGEDAYEPDLVDRLLEELVQTGKAVAGTPSPGDIEPAQLQIVCDTLWQAHGNGVITEAQYDSLADPERPEIVAQQVLDRRLVSEFEKLKTREELALLDRLLPELETEAGTKRVREYADLETSLLSAPGVQADPASLRALLEKLKAARLLDVLKREHGELVELTHDYLVLRLDELRPAIGLIWPRRALREGLKTYRKSGDLLASDVLPHVLARANELELDARSGEFLLRSALGHLADIRPALPALERSGAPVWEVFAERIAEGEDAERSTAIELLTRHPPPEAQQVLRGGLELPVAAPEIVRFLGRAPRASSVELLTEALSRPALASSARIALAELAKAGGPEIGGLATTVLRDWFRAAVAVPDATDEAIENLVDLDYPVSVDLLAEVVEDEGLETVVWDALAELATSPHASVATRARRVVFDRAERALAAGTPESWWVGLLERIEDLTSARLLGRLAPLYPDDAKRALQRLRLSDEAEVAAAAGKELDRLEGEAPEEPEPAPEREPEPLPLRPPASELDAHYNAVLQFLAQGRVVPFLGAGVNIFDRPGGEGWTPGAYPPSAQEVSGLLQEYAYYPTDESPDLLRVSEYFAAVAGRGALYDRLRDLFASDYPPSRLHRLLAEVPRFLRERDRPHAPQVIASTMYDDRLERAFEELDEPYDVLTYVADGSDAGLFAHRARNREPVVVRDPLTYTELQPKERTVILKLHGGIDRRDPEGDSFVITEDDYLDYAVRAAQTGFFPVTIAAALRGSAFLFLGYALRDWNLRVLLRALLGAQPISYRSWAVQLRPSEVDVRLWRQRDVEIVELPLEDYVAGLEERLWGFDAGAVPA
jgi:SIR2-like domain